MTSHEQPIITAASRHEHTHSTVRATTTRNTFTMIARTILFLSAAVLIMALPASVDEATAPENSSTENQNAAAPHMEPPCAKTGGQCMKADECPEGLLSDAKGLCPMQQATGIECCYGLSIREHRCTKRGGQCLPKTRCGRQLWDDRAEDCGKDETCCILV